LDVRERAALAEELLASLGAEDESERAWADEAQRRLEEYRAGRARADSSEDVFRKAHNPDQTRRAVIEWREHLTSDPKICGGQLCAKGTRVLVTIILDSLAEGASREEILRSYPTLRAVHIDAALAYAAELAREESLLPLRPA
jgi:putative addiction module component (TIGR02574 family)